MSEDFYVLRYAAGTPLNQAKHEHTVGRHPTWIDAYDARSRLPAGVAGTLEIQRRTPTDA